MDVPPADAFGRWLGVARAGFYRHDVATLRNWRDFHGELQTEELGDLMLAAWRADPAISYTPAGNKGDLLLHLPSSRAGAEDDGHWFEHGRNDLFLIDSSRPLVARSLEPVERIALRVPRDGGASGSAEISSTARCGSAHPARLASLR